MKIQGTKIRGLKLYSSAATVDADSYFNLVTLLLPGNGTNGAQNNTFLDSSASPLTVTRNGSVTQGAFSPFSFGGGTAQANGYYSGYFDGTGDYLTVPATTTQLIGQSTITSTSTFTIEAWVYPTAASGSVNNGLLIGNMTPTSNTNYWSFGLNSSNLITFFWFDGASKYCTGSSVTLNTWSHIAISVSSGAIKMFVNGVLQTLSGNTTLTNGTGALSSYSIGSYNNSSFPGYISNLRVVQNAIYTANFTVPTTPLTAVTNTSLLTCQSSQFIDNSTNAFAITSFGNSQPTVVNPFGMTDWSGYFDGTGDYLSVANNAAFLLATNNFTIEFWVYPTNVSSTQSILSKGDGGYSPFLIQNSSGSGLIYISSAGSAWDVASGVSLGTIPISTWTHIAITREGNTFKTFKNGIQVSTFSSSASLYNPANPVTIGYNGGGYPEAFYGNISNLRIVNGTALYTANFTPPIAPLTAISGTSLLTCQSSTFIDNSTNAFAITVNGNAYTGTLNNPFGSIVNYTTPPLQAWSNYFDGTGDYLSTTATAVGTNSFTVEAWVYLTAGSSYMGIYSSTEDTSGVGINLGIDNTNNVQGFVGRGNNGTFLNGTTPLSLNTWHHVAFVRNGSALSLYINGTSVDSDTSSASITATSAVIGRFYISYNGFYMNGYISNVRLVNGTAVYTSNFTVPTTPLTATQNTQLLTCQSNRFIDNSISNFAITRYGDTSVQAFSPFEPTEPYSTTSVGGSVYFDGSNSKLTTSANIDISGLFTIECWYNLTVNAGWFFTIGNLPVYVDVNAGQITLDKSSVGVQLTTTANEQAKGKNCWKHLAITRDSGGVIRVFVNGILVGNVTTSYSAGILNGLGAYASYGGNIAGYISNFRVIAGSALYTSNFVPPTAPLTAVSGTSLLVSAINGGITDATAKNVLETVGSAQISTAQSKFGGSSMAFDGNGDYLTIPNNVLFALGTGDFTIECWVYSIAGSNNGVWQLASSAFPGSAGLAVAANGGAWTVYYGSTSQGHGFGSIGTGTWQHVALVRQSGSLYIYSNGVKYTVAASDTTNYTYTTLVIGGYYSTSFLWNGYINDLRITRGYARYTTNFTPPTAAFPTQ